MNVVIVLLTLHVVVSTASLMHVATEDGTLTLEGREEGIDGYIQGYFKSDIEGEGIRFKTTHDSLVITTMDHAPLVKIRKAPVTIQAHGEKDHVIVFQMLDTVFAESNDRTYRVLDVRSNTPVVQERGRFVTHSNFLANLQAEELYDPHQVIQYKVRNYSLILPHDILNQLHGH